MEALAEYLADVFAGVANPYTPIVILTFVGIGTLAYNVRKWFYVYNPSRAGLALRALALGLAACVIFFGLQRAIRKDFVGVTLEVETPTGPKKLFSTTYTAYDMTSMFLEILAASVVGRRLEVYDLSSIVLKSLLEEPAIAFAVAMFIILSLLLLLSTVIGLASFFKVGSSAPTHMARLLPIVFLAYMVLTPLTLPAAGFAEAKRSLLRHGFTGYLVLQPNVENLILRHGEWVLDLTLSFNLGTLAAMLLIASTALVLVFAGTVRLKAEPGLHIVELQQTPPLETEQEVETENRLQTT